MTEPHPLAPAIDRALSEHGPSGSVSTREGWVECECEARLHLPSGLTFDGYAEMWDEERKIRNVHLRDAILAEVEAEFGPVTVERGHTPWRRDRRLVSEWRAES